MSDQPGLHHRRSIRLPGYDYTQCGAYFVTICTGRGECIFGEVVDDAAVLSPLGCIAREEWFHSAEIRREVLLLEDEFVVMPNHIHGIIRIVDVGATGRSPQCPSPSTSPSIAGGATGRSPLPTTDAAARDLGTSSRVRQSGPATRSIGAMIAGYKAAVTIRASRELGLAGTQIWQRNYWEHIVRDTADLERITAYIRSNPISWTLDALHPQTTAANGDS